MVYSVIKYPQELQNKKASWKVILIDNLQEKY